MRVRIATALVLAALAACGGTDTAPARLGTPVALSTPASEGSHFPHLAPGDDGIVMSWMQGGKDGRVALRHATYSGGAWSPLRTVAEGADWFVNWADFPSVVPVSGRTWIAHWLQQRPGGVYAYDVRIAVSDDSGATWSAPFSPHDDGTATEHGFVTLLPAGAGTQAFWLDGRNTGGEHDHSSGGTQGAMTLRSAMIGGSAGAPMRDLELDPRTCDCCQTDAARTSEGIVVVYRDRSADEIRDIALIRGTVAGWSAPIAVAHDGWRTDACPVNGPAVDARDDAVVVAWFTAPDRPRVRVAFSRDGGRTFTPPIDVAVGALSGRVDTVLLPDGRAVVSWLADTPGSAEIRAQIFTPSGPAGAAVTVARTDVARSSGFPQMVAADGGLLFAWTRTGDPPQVRTAFVPIR